MGDTGSYQATRGRARGTWVSRYVSQTFFAISFRLDRDCQHRYVYNARKGINSCPSPSPPKQDRFLSIQAHPPLSPLCCEQFSSFDDDLDAYYISMPLQFAVNPPRKSRTTTPLWPPTVLSWSPRDRIDWVTVKLYNTHSTGGEQGPVADGNNLGGTQNQSDPVEVRFSGGGSSSRAGGSSSSSRRSRVIYCVFPDLQILAPGDWYLEFEAYGVGSGFATCLFIIRSHIIKVYHGNDTNHVLARQTPTPGETDILNLLQANNVNIPGPPPPERAQPSAAQPSAG
ncbi:hypothetical protein F4778DRAFT_725878 [Xylariomycetidae sp. FL2044]|nr:hypothetical protein F4778DRAFT_725878 [Xylariomycetidae sp. FL2044]